MVASGYSGGGSRRRKGKAEPDQMTVVAKREKVLGYETQG